ncbi:MAG TPA: hypothetical protein VN767_05835 [Streptosporangiaceae bacterium]|nr:hypothetical protein [Streptosporangiaceae bacterium]
MKLSPTPSVNCAWICSSPLLDNVFGTAHVSVGELTPCPFDITTVVTGQVTPVPLFVTAEAGTLAKLPDVPTRYWKVMPL